MKRSEGETRYSGDLPKAKLCRQGGGGGIDMHEKNDQPAATTTAHLCTFLLSLYSLFLQEQ
jgi:hypothetical protein